MKRIVLYHWGRSLLMSLISIGLLLIGLVWGLVSTEQGSRWLLATGISTVPSLQVGEIKGCLIDDLWLHQLHYHSGKTFQVAISTLYLQWDIKALFNQQLGLSLTTQGVLVQGQPPSSPESHTDKKFQFPLLPIAIKLKRLIVNDFSWQRPSNPPILIQQLDLSAELNSEHLWLSVLNFNGQGLQLTAEGVIEHQANHPLKLNLNWSYPFKQTQLKGGLIMQGNLQQIHFNSQINSFINNEQHGQLNLSGEIAPAKVTLFNFQLNANQLNPADWGGILQGQLSGLAQVKGQWEEDHIQANVILQQLTGQLENQPIEAHSRIHLSDQQLTIQAAQLIVGHNHLQLQGQLNQSSTHLQIALNAPHLTAILPDLTGHLQGQFLIQGSLTHPQIKGTLTADQLHYREQQLSHLLLAVDYHPLAVKSSYLDLIAQGINWDNQAIKSLRIQATGMPKQHNIEVKLTAPQIKMTLKSEGQWQAKQWRGVIKQFNLLNPQLKNWQLESPVNFQLQPTLDNIPFNLAPGCLVQATAKLCFSGQSIHQVIKAQIRLSDWSLTNLNPWLTNDDLNMHGLLSVQTNLLVNKGQLTADLNAHIQQATINLKSTEQPVHSLPLHQPQLTLHYAQDRWQSDFSLGLGINDYLHAQFNVEPINQVGVRALSGRLQAKLAQLDFIDSLFPQINHLTGVWLADITLAGDTQQPQLKGQLNWQSGQFRIAPLGSHFKQINLAISSQDDLPQRLKIKAQVHSGEGYLKAKGYLDLQPEEQYPLQLKITGKNFQISQIPKAEIAISPNLLLKKQSQSTQISGTIKLDKAMIEIKELPETAITVSADEQIIGIDQVTSKPPLPSLPTMQIGIEFGQHSHFSGFGLKTQLTGQLVYQAKQHQQQVQGKALMKHATYHAYGQNLAIRQGEFLFNGVADNPWLNIEAVRQADDGVTAILKVTGPIKNPKTQIFTEPVHSESEALAYLMTGSSIKGMSQNNGTTLANAALNYGTGQLAWLSTQLGIDEFEFKHGKRLEDSAVKLGKYLNPDLYIGVTMGLFSNTYMTRLRYRLSDHFSIRTRAGETQRIELKYHLQTD